MGMLYRRKKNGLETGPWWMKYYDHGKPIYQSTEKYEKRDAIAVLRRMEAKVVEGQREGTHLQRTRFEDLISGLKHDYVIKGFKSWDRREDHINHLLTVFKGMRVKSISTETLKGYVAKRLEEGAAPATINRELACLRRMMILGAHQTPPVVGRIPHFPTMSETKVREGFFEHDEFLSLRGAAPDYIKTPLTIAYYTGMRLREIISQNGLRWEQVNLTEGSIRLTAAQTKTSHARVIYMGDDFLEVMRETRKRQLQQYPQCPYVCQRRGKPFNELRKGFLNACARVGLVGKTFHDLRRTGVRNLIRAGVPETVAMKISGHKSRSIFDRYNITSEQDLQDAASKLNQYIQQKKGYTFGDTAPESESYPFEIIEDSILKP